MCPALPKGPDTDRLGKHASARSTDRGEPARHRCKLRRQFSNHGPEGLLELSRVDTKGWAFESVNLTALCQRAIMSLSATISEARAEVTHDNLPTVMGDGRQLAQLLQNLIGNAVKFRNSVPPVVHVSAEQWEDKWRLSVRDNGIGIEAENVEHIFGIFKRLHAQSEYPGSGIGLSICKRIVERHNGRIWVEPQPDEGTVFYLTLPREV